MDVINFVETECVRYGNIDNNIKAQILLKAINTEIAANNTFNSRLVVQTAEQSTYYQELRVVKHLLQFYIDRGKFNMNTSDIPYVGDHPVRYNLIKVQLQSHFTT